MVKKRIALLFGGQSAEHEVSLRSAANVAAALDKDKYDVVFIGIDKNGKWLPNRTPALLASAESSAALWPVAQQLPVPDELPAVPDKIDVVFPVLHGPFGEDGSVQGLLKVAGIPFIGAGVLGSAVGMDKDVMKRLLRDAGLPIGRYRAVRSSEIARLPIAEVVAELGLPIFVKPANLGSSVGISKANSAEELVAALAHAAEYDTKLVLEEFIAGREIECAVLGNEDPQASVPGEIVVHADFYSYDAKYTDAEACELQIPAQITPEQTAAVRELAVKTFTVLGCEGLARVDFFLRPSGEFVVNEINTIPGFTDASMYPLLWQATGLGFSELLDKLVELALSRHETQARLKKSR